MSETNKFTFGTQMYTERSYFGCCIFNKKLFVFGGNLKEKKTIIDLVEVYDIENDVWSKGPKFPLPLSLFGDVTEDKLSNVVTFHIILQIKIYRSTIISLIFYTMSISTF